MAFSLVWPLAFSLLTLSSSASLAQDNRDKSSADPSPTPIAATVANPVVSSSSNYLLDFEFFADNAQYPSESNQKIAIDLGYHLSEKADIALRLVYTGRLYPKGSQDAGIWDPEINYFYEWELTQPKVKNHWLLDLGIGVFMPLAPESIDQGEIGGLTFFTGISFRNDSWVVDLHNKLYVDFYRSYPTYVPLIGSGSEDEGAIRGADDEKINIQDLSFYYNTTNFRVRHKWNSSFSSKIEVEYDTEYHVEGNPLETLTLWSTTYYFISPKFKIFAGIVTSGRIDVGDSTLLNYHGTGLRLGFFKIFY